MNAESLKEMKKNIGSLWDMQTRQRGAFKTLKEADNDIDDEILDELIEKKEKEAEIFGRLIDKFDSMIEEVEGGV